MKRERESSSDASLLSLPLDVMCLITDALDGVSRFVFYWVAHSARAVLGAPPPYLKNICDAAARAGYGTVLAWAREMGCDASESHYHALRGAHLALARSLVGDAPPHTSRCVAVAARSGCLGTLAWALQAWPHSHEMITLVVKIAAKRGHLHIVRQYTSLPARGARETVARLVSVAVIAARYDQIAVLRWVLDNADVSTDMDRDSVFRGAVVSDTHDCLALLYERWPEWMRDHASCCAAVCIERLDQVRWLREHGARWCPCVVRRSAIDDHVLLDWAVENGAPCDALAAQQLAKHGHTAHLKTYISGGTIVDVRVAEEVARRGDLALLQWLRAHNCPWDRAVRDQAREHGHDALLQWAAANGCPTALSLERHGIGLALVGGAQLAVQLVQIHMQYAQ